MACVSTMGDQFEEVGTQFVAHYYQTFDTDRSQLAVLYNENSICSYEGTQMKGQVSVGMRSSRPRACF